MGLQALKTRFEDPVMLATSFTGLFPKDNPKNTRFAINVLTNIGLGALSYVSWRLSSWVVVCSEVHVV